MTWLESQQWSTTAAGVKFAQIIDRPGGIQIPGAHNALAGRLAKRAGFSCLYSGRVGCGISQVNCCIDRAAAFDVC